MRSALIHGVLLVVMLVYGYRTWTRDKTIQPDLGSVVLWDKTEADLVSIELKNEKKDVKIERHGGEGADGYWWGVDTTTDKKPKKKDDKKKDEKKDDKKDAGSGAGSGSAAAAGSGAGSAAVAGKGSASGSGAGSAAVADKGSAAGNGSGTPILAEKGSAAGSAAGSGSASLASGSGAGSGSAAVASNGSGAGSGSAAEEVTVKTHEFPLGDNGDKLIKAILAARALRDLGTANDEQKKEYKLTDAKQTLAITFKDGTHSFLIGGSVYGGSDRYVIDQQTQRAYVLSKDLINGLEIGESNLHLTDPRGFEAGKIEAVTIAAGDKTKTAARIESTSETGTQVKTWGDADTGKADQTLANFIDEVNNLKPTEYQSNTKIADLTPVLKLSYRDEHGTPLGSMSLYKHDKPPPADKPDAKPELEYLVVTEKTRVPGVVRKDQAQRAENDVTTVFSDHPTEGSAAGSGAGSGTPFKFDPSKMPTMPTRPGGGNPHGAVSHPPRKGPPSGSAPTPPSP